jgi:hypothetical protein
VALAQGDAARARELFGESQRLFRELDFTWSIADYVIGLAGVEAQEGHAEQAAVLYGAAEAAHEAVDSSGLLVEAANKLDRDREVVAACRALEEEVWNTAWKKGRAMSIDEAVAYLDRASQSY